jgi:hypothetical protein
MPRNIKTDIPHGSVLAPVMYSLYIVTCYATEDAVRIVNWFYLQSPQSLIPLLHVYTVYKHYTLIFSLDLQQFSRSYHMRLIQVSLNYTLPILTAL